MSWREGGDNGQENRRGFLSAGQDDRNEGKKSHPRPILRQTWSPDSKKLANMQGGDVGRKRKQGKGGHRGKGSLPTVREPENQKKGGNEVKHHVAAVGGLRSPSRRVGRERQRRRKTKIWGQKRAAA